MLNVWQISGRRYQSEGGVVTLEFLFIAPLLVALLYAFAVYGLLFLYRLEMQTAVNKATATVLSLDRRQFSSYGAEAKAHSEAALAGLITYLPARVRNHVTVKSCDEVTNEGVVLLECRLQASNSDGGWLPQIQLKGVGGYPPQPDTIEVRAAVAF